jgi:hypothetical protein
MTEHQPLTMKSRAFPSPLMGEGAGEGDPGLCPPSPLSSPPRDCIVIAFLSPRIYFGVS